MFFNRDWNKPGPGVAKDEPKKKGVARFFEVFVRQAGSLVKLNALLILFLLSPLALFLLSSYQYAQGNIPFAIVALLCSLLAALPLGAVLTSFYYLLVQMLRDEPFFLWHDFFRKYRESFKLTSVPGLVFALFLCGIGFLFLFGNMFVDTLPIPVLGLYCLAILSLFLLFPFFFVQAAFLELSVKELFQNSLLLAFANLPRSLPGAVLGSGLVLLQVFFFPFTVPSLLLLGLSLPALLNLLWIWPKIDSVFKINSTLKNRQDEQYYQEK